MYLYSRLRTSDFLPVDLEQKHPEKIERGCPTRFFFFFFGFSFLCVVVCSECGGVGYASVSDGSDCEDKELLDDEHDSHLAALRAPAEDTSFVAAELSNDLAF